MVTWALAGSFNCTILIPHYTLALQPDFFGGVAVNDHRARVDVIFQNDGSTGPGNLAMDCLKKGRSGICFGVWRFMNSQVPSVGLHREILGLEAILLFTRMPRWLRWSRRDTLAVE